MFYLHIVSHRRFRIRYLEVPKNIRGVLELDVTSQHFVCADGVNLQGDNINTTGSKEAQKSCQREGKRSVFSYAFSRMRIKLCRRYKRS